MNIKKILSSGSLKIKVKNEGMLQTHTLKIEKEISPFGPIPILISELPLPEMELLRIAKETGLPIKRGNLRVFPPGKMPKDLANLL
ncbi:MAG: hypothetical protein PHU63_00650 [Candidatus ainarchaeum sp.]|nr:hypothetical protein [Candidatus ainarchaeum sp.]